MTAGKCAFLSVRKCNLFEHSTSSCLFGNNTGRRRRRLGEDLQAFEELIGDLDSYCKLSCPRFECSVRKLIEGELLSLHPSFYQATRNSALKVNT